MKTGIVIFTLTMAFIIFFAVMAKNAHAKPAESNEQARIELSS